MSPRITEKGAYLSESGVYVFNVAMVANKSQIVDAIKETFKVTPRKVTVVVMPRKQTQTRGTNRKGLTAAGKKAYVFLKKGDTIDLV
ncbi:MAG: ribosomal protein [Candidatus Adlerbacteria bacterium]|nr:ribosomal protein [Candidatus Adlerbacteria bacterium]